MTSYVVIALLFNITVTSSNLVYRYAHTSGNIAPSANTRITLI